MSEVITCVLKLTFGLLANKIRSEITERLKDGDVTDEECRRLIVRELDDIKSKLNGLARKDLLSCLCFLQEGITSLYQSLFRLHSDEVTAKSTEQATLVEAATSSRDTGHDSVIVDAAAVINAITSLKIHSNDRFKSAIESFKLARENATIAFCNEALSIKDRIEATQIRMMARILEKLENPDASVSDCLQYLKQLHDIGAIQEIFSVLIDGGIKSRFNKTKRVDNASSVQLMNQILFQFARKFTKLRLRYLTSWPVISFGKQSYRPVFGEYRLTEKLQKSGVENTCAVLLNPDIEFHDKILPKRSVVNSKGEILAVTEDERRIKDFKRSGESRTLCEVPREEDVLRWDVAAMDIDAEDNIYLITSFRKRDEKPLSLKLFIFDENGNKKLECPLPFLQKTYSGVSMTINKDGNIDILNCEEKTLYVGKVCLENNSCGVEKSLSFHQLSGYLVRFADFIGTKKIVATKFNFCIYTDNVQLEREITIPDKEREWECFDSVAINHIMKRILVKKKDLLGRCSLVSFSKTGDLIDSFHLGSSEWIRDAELTSHPNGPVALVGETKAALLQLQ